MQLWAWRRLRYTFLRTTFQKGLHSSQRNVSITSAHVPKSNITLADMVRNLFQRANRGGCVACLPAVSIGRAEIHSANFGGDLAALAAGSSVRVGFQSAHRGGCMAGLTAVSRVRDLFQPWEMCGRPSGRFYCSGCDSISPSGELFGQPRCRS